MYENYTFVNINAVFVDKYTKPFLWQYSTTVIRVKTVTIPVEQSAPVYPGLQLHVPPEHAPFPLHGSGTHGSTTAAKTIHLIFINVF